MLVGDTWFSFFHGSRPFVPGSEQKIYSVGFYGFSAPAAACGDAHDAGADRFGPEHLAAPYSFFLDYMVAYPSGALYVDGTWLVSLGIHDRGSPS